MTAELKPEDEPKWRRRRLPGMIVRGRCPNSFRERGRRRRVLHAAHASAVWNTVGKAKRRAGQSVAGSDSCAAGSLCGRSLLRSATEFFTGRDSAPWGRAYPCSCHKRRVLGGDAQSGPNTRRAASDQSRKPKKKKSVLATARVPSITPGRAGLTSPGGDGHWFESSLPVSGRTPVR
jgi:hypothetical protein